jgi:hypothetical protein
MRNAAIFYDLENVLGGYGDGLGRRVAGLSLDDIERQISQGRYQGSIGSYAVKRAYADWSTPNLKVLRKALVEQGIEPRQVFGFGDGGKTNAADIELVIDVLELAYTRPEVSLFVIVSGDGGFGSVVRKLHEFGKTVVVAGYPERSGRALRAVCDEFVELRRVSADPKAPATPVPAPITAPVAGNGTSAGKVGLWVDFERAAPAPPATPALDRATHAQAVRDLIIALQADERCRARLGDGVSLALFGALAYRYVDRGEVRASGGLQALLGQALPGTGYVIEHPGTGQARLIAEGDGAPASQPPSPTRPQPEVFTELSEVDPRMLPFELRPLVEQRLQDMPDDQLPMTMIGNLMPGPEIRQVIRDFYGSMTSLLRVALSVSDACVVRMTNQAADTAVRWRDAAVEAADAEILAELPPLTEDRYARVLLRRAQLGMPDDPNDLHDIMTALVAAPPRGGETVEDVAARLVEDGTVPEAVELATLTDTLHSLNQMEVLGAAALGDSLQELRDELGRKLSVVLAEHDVNAEYLLPELLGPSVVGAQDGVADVEPAPSEPAVIDEAG